MKQALERAEESDAVRPQTKIYYDFETGNYTLYIEEYDKSGTSFSEYVTRCKKDEMKEYLMFFLEHYSVYTCGTCVSFDRSVLHV
jgi:hypothetical protein